MCPMSSAPESTQDAPPARGASHYAKGTAANMVRSMAVILVLVLAIYVVAGLDNSQAPESLDVEGSAQHHAQQSGHPFAYPEGLPDGWVATSVRYETSGEAMTWNAGYTTPDEEHVSIRQAADPGDAWLGAQTDDGTTVGSVTTKDGEDWVQRDREGKDRRSLVNEPEAKGELTTVVTGTGSWEQLEGVAERLVEADTGSRSTGGAGSKGGSAG